MRAGLVFTRLALLAVTACKSEQERERERLEAVRAEVRSRPPAPKPYPDAAPKGRAPRALGLRC